jgi:hypothetical protein
LLSSIIAERIGQIREARPALEQRRLRLIYSGRLLTDGVILHDWLKKLEAHQGIEDHGLVWLHCSVGPKFEVGESDTSEVLQVSANYLSQ